MDDLLNNENRTSDSDSDEECIRELNKLIENAKCNIIPENSKRLYELQYEKFQNWCLQMKIMKIDENIVLTYFEKLSQNYKATTLWATYTKLKSMLKFKQNIDISKYTEVQCFLKTKAKHDIVQKSKVFTKDEISEFINDASDDKFLLHKVVLLIGLYGCLRKIELLNIKINDIKRQGSLYHITIPVTKTGGSKSFVTSASAFPIIKKYIKLRPEGMERFFLQYRNKKCTRQNVGKGKIGTIPQEIAKFLNLPEAKKYTGHAFRRTSTILLANKGVDILTFKRRGAWKNRTVAESHTNESIQNEDISNLISTSNIGVNAINSMQESYCAGPSTSKQSTILSQTEVNEIIKITQNELEEAIETDFYSNKKLKRSKSNINDNLIDALQNISQEEFEEEIETEFSFPEIKMEKDEEQVNSNIQNITQEKILSTDFLSNISKKEKPIYIFKNCNLTINKK